MTDKPQRTTPPELFSNLKQHETRVVKCTAATFLIIAFWIFYFGGTHLSALRILESNDIQKTDNTPEYFELGDPP